MKIIIVSQYYWPENFRINDFADGLIEKGHEISVLTGIPNYPGGRFHNGWKWWGRKHEVYKGINIYRSLLFPRGSGNNFMLAINYISFAVFASIRALFLRGKFDLIFVYEPSPITVGLPAIVIKKLKKLPIYFWVTDLWPESIISAGNSKSVLISKLLNPLVKFIYKQSDKILVSSRGFINSIIDKGVSIQKIEYFPYWAESIFKPVKNEEYLLGKIPNNSFKIMFAGNIGEAQDFPSILEAARLLRKNQDIHWIILGDGRKKEWVQSRIVDLKLEDNFHLLGSYPLKEMPKFYSQADTMLLALKKEHIFSITIPAKVQSYMACGKPILAMIDGESANIIDEGYSGLTCPAENPSGLAENVLKMKAMRELGTLHEIGTNAREYYTNNFERSFLLNKAEELFSSKLRNSSR